MREKLNRRLLHPLPVSIGMCGNKGEYHSPYPYRESQKLHWLYSSGLTTARSVVKTCLSALLLDIWRAAQTEI